MRLALYRFRVSGITEDGLRTFAAVVTAEGPPSKIAARRAVVGRLRRRGLKVQGVELISKSRLARPNPT